MRALFDTNILIDYLSGSEQAHAVIRSAQDRAISIVSWIEAMAGADKAPEAELRTFLSSFTVLDLDTETADVAAFIRRTYRLKLPDAVIWATARITGRTLVTRDIKDFPADDPGVHVPYRLP